MQKGKKFNYTHSGTLFQTLFSFRLCQMILHFSTQATHTIWRKHKNSIQWWNGKFSSIFLSFWLSSYSFSQWVIAPLQKIDLTLWIKVKSIRHFSDSELDFFFFLFCFLLLLDSNLMSDFLLYYELSISHGISIYNRCACFCLLLTSKESWINNMELIAIEFIVQLKIINYSKKKWKKK